MEIALQKEKIGDLVLWQCCLLNLVRGRGPWGVALTRFPPIRDAILHRHPRHKGVPLGI